MAMGFIPRFALEIHGRQSAACEREGLFEPSVRRRAFPGWPWRFPPRHRDTLRLFLRQTPDRLREA